MSVVRALPKAPRGSPFAPRERRGRGPCAYSAAVSSSNFGRTHPPDAVVGVAMRIFTLGGLALGLGLYAASIAIADGISTRFSGYRAWVFFIPALSAFGAASFALRTSYWFVRGLTVSQRQFMTWRRNLLAEMLFTGMGGFCVAVGNVPGMAIDLGPFGLIAVIAGLAFLGSPQAVLIDGERRRILKSGFFYASSFSLDTAEIAPLCVRERNRNTGSVFESWHLGDRHDPITGAIPRDEAYRLAAYVVARTGAPTKAVAPAPAPVASAASHAAGAVPAARPASAERPAPAQSGDESPVRKRRLLVPSSVSFEALAQQLTSAGYTNALPELGRSATLWKGPPFRDPQGLSLTPTVSVEIDPSFGAHKITLEWFGPRQRAALPLPTTHVDTILSPEQSTDQLKHGLAQLEWLTCTNEGWTALDGAMATTRTKNGHTYVVYDPSPRALEAVTALSRSADPAVAQTAQRIHAKWKAQTSINHS